LTVPPIAPATSPLDGLLAVSAALRTSPDLEPTLKSVAESVAQTLKVATVAINLYRPAFHDFETVAVHGAEEARRLLLGSRSPAEEWAQLIDERFQRRGAYFIPHGAFNWEVDATLSYVPDISPSDDPDAWLAEDALFVPLRSTSGSVVGILSVDEPHHGRRPADHDLDVLVSVAVQAALAIESAQYAETAQRHRADVQELLRVSSRLTIERSRAGVARAACEGIYAALGYERVALMLREPGCDRFSVAVAEGFGDGAPAGADCDESDLTGLLAAEDDEHGCILLSREAAHQRTPAFLHRVYSSCRNGRGPHAWDHHWLLVPLRDEDGSLIGLIWPDDPVDRLVPTVERLQTLRAFGNQIASALEATATRERLRFLAQHDPLTGLRNRRELNRSINEAIATSGAEGVALIVADADAFKRVNDELGYETGDAVLKSLASIIDETLPPSGFAARLGGEEFALVLPRMSVAGARLAAEAMRRRVAETIDVPWGLTVSAGLAVSGLDAGDADALMRAAARALHVAKRLGRDRVVVYDPVTLESLLASLDAGDGRDAEQLAAVLLLAETLDLRDAGTARHSQTVGRYAEQVAAQLGFDGDHVERIKIAGLLHDVGKLAVADAILHKPGVLEPDEWAEVRRHAEIGARICSHAGLRDVAAWVLAHHERWDGTGYPHAIAGSAIPIEARILAVADAYEAMTAVRPYRTTPLSTEAAQQELRNCAGAQFDPDVVGAFISVLGAGH
jgi:diguanylate cyclase (GGDEF)-like protein/putative nucleotidyltransferase with HDIG domain